MTERFAQHRKISEDPRLPQIGEAIKDRYRIESVVGEGGFGVVFLATDLAAGGRVAVKVMDPKRGTDDSFIQRFKQEVLLVRSLRHHNTIKVWDVGQTANGAPFMAMEYVEGESLAHIVDTGGPMPLERTLRLTSQMLRSLAEAHRLGIVHRDLKPTNVIVAQLPDEADYVKVLDFGIAKALDAELTKVHTVSGEIMCTPTYASPELLRKRGIGPPSDVYGMALIMVEMLTGQVVMRAASLAEVVAKQLSPDAVVLPPEISALPIGPVIARALEKDPRQRYANAEEMLKALMAITQPASTTTQVNAAATLSVGPSRFWIAAVLIVVVAGGLAAILVQMASNRPENPLVDAGDRDVTAALTLECDAANGPACNARATAYERGEGAPIDIERAMFHYQAACDARFGPACQALGRLYAFGQGVTRDDARALAFYAQGCDLGGAESCLEAGRAHQAGTGTPADSLQAATFYEAACNRGLGEGCMALGNLYLTGNGVAEDPLRAVQLFGTACGARIASACTTRGQLLEEGNGLDIDYPGARAAYQSGCELGDTQACHRLGMLYRSGRIPTDMERAREYFQRACDRGMAESCGQLGELYAEGVVGEAPDPVLARDLFERACAADVATACLSLGDLVASGTGGASDPERARSLFSRACQLGNPTACERAQQ